jgi:hypothetical protein
VHFVSNIVAEGKGVVLQEERELMGTLIFPAAHSALMRQI